MIKFHRNTYMNVCIIGGMWMKSINYTKIISSFWWCTITVCKLSHQGKLEESAQNFPSQSPVNVWLFWNKCFVKASEVAQWVKTFAAKLEDLSSIPSSHIVEENHISLKSTSFAYTKQILLKFLSIDLWNSLSPPLSLLVSGSIYFFYFFLSLSLFSGVQDLFTHLNPESSTYYFLY